MGICGWAWTCFLLKGLALNPCPPLTCFQPIAVLFAVVHSYSTWSLCEFGQTNCKCLREAHDACTALWKADLVNSWKCHYVNPGLINHSLLIIRGDSEDIPLSLSRPMGICGWAWTCFLLKGLALWSTPHGFPRIWILLFVKARLRNGWRWTMAMRTH